MPPRSSDYRYGVSSSAPGLWWLVRSHHNFSRAPPAHPNLALTSPDLGDPGPVSVNSPNCSVNHPFHTHTSALGPSFTPPLHTFQVSGIPLGSSFIPLMIDYALGFLTVIFSAQIRYPTSDLMIDAFTVHISGVETPVNY